MGNPLKWMTMLILLSGACCTYQLEQTSFEQSIVTGKTTKTEILFLLGEPDKRYHSGALKAISGKEEYLLQDPNEVWLYYPAFNLIDLVELRTTRIGFDTKGVVNYYTR